MVADLQMQISELQARIRWHFLTPAMTTDGTELKTKIELTPKTEVDALKNGTASKRIRTGPTPLIGQPLPPQQAKLPEEPIQPFDPGTPTLTEKTATSEGQGSPRSIKIATHKDNSTDQRTSIDRR